MTGMDLVGTFVRERWLSPPSSHQRRHQLRLQRFLSTDLPKAPFYRGWAGRPLPALPIVDKATVLADFAAFNSRGITLERALEVAERAERSRDFTPTIDGVVVGLSSGTSGRRGVFLIGPEEQPRWAGTLLAQLIAPESLRLLRTRGLRISLFLRANSTLYESLGSARVRFRYHDLTLPLERHLAAVADADVVVGPASVLVALTELCPGLRPTQVIAAAETLEPDDARRIEAAWGRRVEQIYQATEGLLGVSCPEGRVHLNESFCHIEPEWLDERRFTPIVTDFARTTQFVVRYRLDDVLLAAEGPCGCGRPGRSVEAILGRSDDVLDLGGTPVYPDALRHAIALADPGDYRIEQHGEQWRVALRGGSMPAIHRELRVLAARLGAPAPEIVAMPWPREDVAAKRRRVRRVR